MCLTALALSSCLARRRLITRIGARPNQTLLTADSKALLATIDRQYNAIRDFNATVDMTPALGSTEKSKVTEYKDVRAFILYRRPNDIRIVGLFPVVRNKAFDMVSTGPNFELYLPSKNRFIIGRNELVQPSSNKIENLRPQHFLDALVVRPVDTSKDKLLLENFTDESNAYYILHLIRENPDGSLRLSRTVWFDRLNLQLTRQLVFDDTGNILTDARYSHWQPYDNVAFPKHIEINRPRDEYGAVIEIIKMDVNKGVSDDKFVLNQPEGTRLQVLGQPPAPKAPQAQGSRQ